MSKDQEREVWKFEFLITFLVFITFLVSIMIAFFFFEIGYAELKALEIFKDYLTLNPQLNGVGAIGLAISLLALWLCHIIPILHWCYVGKYHVRFKKLLRHEGFTLLKVLLV